MDKQKQKSTTKHQKLRSFFSSMFGIIAVFLIMASISVVWLNRTIVSTSTYVGTVAPMVSKPAIQNFIADKVTNQLINSSPINNIASGLLPATDLNKGLDSSQLKALVKPIIQADVISIVKSPSFATLWKNTNQSAHAQLISQLNGNSQQLTLDLHPAFVGIVNELKDSQLSQVANHLSVGPTAGNLDIKGNKVGKLRSYYKLFQLGTLGFILMSLIAFSLAVWIAVNHHKVARRIVLICGILALVGALILEIPQFVSIKSSDPVTQNGIRAIISAVTHNLLILDITIGVVFVGYVVIHKIVVKKKTKSKPAN